MAQRVKAQYVQFYTYGTAARKLEPVVPHQQNKVSLPKPKKIKRKKIYVDPVAILGVVVAICMLIVMATGVDQLKQARAEAVAMEQYVDQLAREHETLVDEYAHSYDIGMIEQTAIALGMVPIDTVHQSTIEISLPPVEEPPTTWETIGTFLTGLFA